MDDMFDSTGAGHDDLQDDDVSHYFSDFRWFTHFSDLDVWIRIQQHGNN